jgi:hypothetical protein
MEIRLGIAGPAWGAKRSVAGAGPDIAVNSRCSYCRSTLYDTVYPLVIPLSLLGHTMIQSAAVCNTYRDRVGQRWSWHSRRRSGPRLSRPCKSRLLLGPMTCGTVRDRGGNDDGAAGNLALPRDGRRFRMRRLLWIRNAHD